MRTLLQDLRFGARMLLKKPGFTIVAVITLALGIGANTAVFSLINAVLLRPLQFYEPERLVMVWEDASFAGFPQQEPAPANYVDWKARQSVFEDMAALEWGKFSLTGDGEPQQVYSNSVTSNFFTLLGVAPALGRTFSPEEEKPGANKVVVLSNNFWQRRYGGDLNIIGREILLDDEKYAVIGVMPAEFEFMNSYIGLWVPMAYMQEKWANRKSHHLNVVARMKRGVSLREAQAEIQTITQGIALQYPRESFDGKMGSVMLPLLIPGSSYDALQRQVTDDYLRTMGITLRQGRYFDETDKEWSTPVAIINETMARQYWPDQDLLGKRFKLGDSGSNPRWITVVGVGADIRQMGVDAPVKAEMYLPYQQHGFNWWMAPGNLAIRVSGDPMSMVAAVSREIHAVEPDIPISVIATMAKLLGEETEQRLVGMVLLAIFAGVALLLAALGIYGVLAYFVAERTREIGVRVALGAQTRDVMKMVMKQGMTLALFGIAVGLISGFALARLMKGLLFGVSASDPLTFASVAALLAAVALLACYIPARRATKVDPLVALRCE